MADSKFVKESLGAPLSEAGFKRKSNSWYWSNDEVVLLVNLQKSQYGAQYYVNCGVALKSIDNIEFPKEHHCHIRFRLTSVVSEEKKEGIESVFNLENESLTDQQRKNEISMLIRNIALPILKECATKNGIAKVIKDGRLARAMVHKQVKELVC